MYSSVQMADRNLVLNFLYNELPPAEIIKIVKITLLPLLKANAIGIIPDTHCVLTQALY